MYKRSEEKCGGVSIINFIIFIRAFREVKNNTNNERISIF